MRQGIVVDILGKQELIEGHAADQDGRDDGNIPEGHVHRDRAQAAERAQVDDQHFSGAAVPEALVDYEEDEDQVDDADHEHGDSQRPAVKSVFRINIEGERQDQGGTVQEGIQNHRNPEESAHFSPGPDRQQEAEDSDGAQGIPHDRRDDTKIDPGGIRLGIFFHDILGDQQRAGEDGQPETALVDPAGQDVFSQQDAGEGHDQHKGQIVLSPQQCAQFRYHSVIPASEKSRSTEWKACRRKPFRPAGTSAYYRTGKADSIGVPECHVRKKPYDHCVTYGDAL